MQLPLSLLFIQLPLLLLCCCCSSSGSHREHTHPAPDSLPAIRLLMREMEVAVREEDYEHAARIRDHPWMRLAEDINMHRYGKCAKTGRCQSLLLCWVCRRWLSACWPNSSSSKEEVAALHLK